MSEKTRLGKIEIAPTAIASLASQAVLKSYGVVGMTARGLAQVLRRDAHRGVEVRLEGDEIIIDLYVVLEYGTRISTVAQNIMSNVKFSVEKALGVPVSQVNVHVQALRVSSHE
ncbi:MAG: Asp23/Gls24 family envelope stress response protein [Anaerolineae bacterium]|nr:Asp23/Gls24 family envelope stress response protein [Anaerolineae bacterium]RLC62158.1 MAG: Asp23/Gls24 family envelope stress response protein [Chloroflexota bacterium]